MLSAVASGIVSGVRYDNGLFAHQLLVGETLADFVDGLCAVEFVSLIDEQHLAAVIAEYFLYGSRRAALKRLYKHFF